jgi:HAD superfamily hydrolase (TIGR01490 family)
VKGRMEVQEVQEVNEVKEKSGGVAVFFDLDGTLVALPSLEKRFFRMLRCRRAIAGRNYFLWLRETMRLAPRGISAIMQANKMYLRGVQILDERGEGDGDISSWHKDGHQAEGQASAPARRNPRLPVPTFFAPAIERVAWHAKQGHEIVLISGTLEPLAREAARTMEAELAARGITVTIRVFATRLEEMNSTWTGRVLGEAMFGEEKARAATRVAKEMQLDLARCYAYGDSLNDRWLMEAVGRPAAVNPSRDLASMARTRGWPVLDWEGKESPTQRRRGHGEVAEKKDGAGRLHSSVCRDIAGWIW